jgi:hypothetical protein
MVNCEQVWREISNYLEDEVDAPLRAAMDEHFRSCRRCTSVLEGMRNVIGLYGDERMIEAPAGFGKRLERRLAQTTRPVRSWSTWNAWLVPVAALMLFAGGLRIASSSISRQPLRSEHAQGAHNIPPDMLVVVTANAKVFHAAGCPFIHNKPTERTLTAKEAMREGYVPCLRCMRKYLDIAASVPGRAAQTQADSGEEDADEDGRGD